MFELDVYALKFEGTYFFNPSYLSVYATFEAEKSYVVHFRDWNFLIKLYKLRIDTGCSFRIRRAQMNEISIASRT